MDRGEEGEVMSETKRQKVHRDAEQELVRVLVSHRRMRTSLEQTKANGYVTAPCRCGDSWAPRHQLKELLEHEEAVAAVLSDDAMLAELVKRGRLRVELT